MRSVLWLTLLVAAAWAVGPLTLAVPRTVGSLLAAPAFPVVLAMHRGESVSRGELDAAAEILARALPWNGGARARTDLGYVLLLRAAEARVEAGDAGRAGEMLRQGLLRAPARPHAWVRLAYARTLEKGPAVAGPVMQSFAAGPYVPAITVPRLDLLLRHWDALPTEGRRRTAEQIRYAWTLDDAEVIALARRTVQSHIIRFALAPLPGGQARLDAALARP